MSQAAPEALSSKTAAISAASFMTIKEVSEFLRIPKRTLYEWVSQRRIPHFKFGPAVLRFRADEIEAWARHHHKGEVRF
ncbi:MAG: helix-turn-helix domain-containing protein [Elusimicrobiota bacterium]